MSDETLFNTTAVKAEVADIESSLEKLSKAIKSLNTEKVDVIQRELAKLSSSASVNAQMMAENIKSALDRALQLRKDHINEVSGLNDRQYAEQMAELRDAISATAALQKLSLDKTEAELTIHYQKLATIEEAAALRSAKLAADSAQALLTIQRENQSAAQAANARASAKLTAERTAAAEAIAAIDTKVAATSAANQSAAQAANARASAKLTAERTAAAEAISAIEAKTAATSAANQSAAQAANARASAKLTAERTAAAEAIAAIDAKAAATSSANQSAAQAANARATAKLIAERTAAAEVIAALDIKVAAASEAIAAIDAKAAATSAANQSAAQAANARATARLVAERTAAAEVVAAANAEAAALEKREYAGLAAAADKHLATQVANAAAIAELNSERVAEAAKNAAKLEAVEVAKWDKLAAAATTYAAEQRKNVAALKAIDAEYLAEAAATATKLEAIQKAAQARAMQVAINNATGPYQNYNPVSGAAGGVVNTISNPIHPNAAKDAGLLDSVMQALYGHTNDVHTAVRGLASSFGSLGMMSGALLPLLAGVAVSMITVGSMKKGAEFEQSLFTIGILAENSAEDVNVLRDALLHISDTSKYGPIEAAHALETLALAGLTAKQAMEALKPTLDFSSAGGVDAKEGAETLVAVATAYGYLSGKQQEATSTGAAFSRVGDIIAKTAADTMASVSTMSESFKTSSVVAQQYGITLDDTAMSLGMLAQIGITGTAAGTSYRNMIVELNKESGRAGATIKELGVAIQDSATNKMRPLIDVMGDITKRMAEYTALDQRKILENITNERGAKDFAAFQKAIMVEVDKANPKLAEQMEQIRSTGTAAELAAFKATTLSAAIKELGDKAAEATKNSAGFSFFASMKDEATPLAQFKAIAAEVETALVKAFDSIADRAYLVGVALKAAFASPGFQGGVNAILSGVMSVVESVVSATAFLYAHRDAVEALAIGYVVAFTRIGAALVAASLPTFITLLSELAIGLGILAPAAVVAETAIAGVGVASTTTAVAATAAVTAVSLGTAALVALGVAAIVFAANWERAAVRAESSAKRIRDAALGAATAGRDAATAASQTDDERMDSELARLNDWRTNRSLTGSSAEATRIEETSKAVLAAIANKEKAKTEALNAVSIQASIDMIEARKDDASWGEGYSDNVVAAIDKASMKEAKALTESYDAKINVMKDKAEKIQALKRAQANATETEAQNKSGLFTGDEHLKDPKAKAKAAARAAKANEPSFVYDSDNSLSTLKADADKRLSALTAAYNNEKTLLDGQHAAHAISEGEFQVKTLQSAQDYEAKSLADLAETSQKAAAIYERQQSDIAAVYTAAAAAGDKDAMRKLASQNDNLANSYNSLVDGIETAKSKINSVTYARMQASTLAATKAIYDLTLADKEYWKKDNRAAEKAKALDELNQKYININTSVFSLDTATRDAEIAATQMAETHKEELDKLTTKLELAVEVQDKWNKAVTEKGLPVTAEELQNLAIANNSVATLTALIASAKDKALNSAAEAGALAFKKAVDAARNTINAALTDSIMTALEQGGKAGSKKLVDFLRDELLRKPFRMIINGVISSITGGAMNAAGIGSAAGGAGGAGGMINMASNGYGLVNAAGGYSNGVNTAASWLGAGTTSGSSAAALGYGNAVGAMGGDGLGAMIAANGSWAGVAAPVAEGAGVAIGSGAASGAAATGTFLGMGPVGWMALAAVAAYVLFSDHGKPSSSTGDSSIDFDASGKEVGRFDQSTQTSYRASASPQADAIVKGMQKDYATTAASLGIKPTDSTFGYGSNDGAGGEHPNLAVSSRVGNSIYKTAGGETPATPESLKLEASRAVLSALQASDLPNYLKGAFDGLTVATMTQDQITATITGAQALKTFHDQLQTLPFENLKDLSFSAATGLIAASGGLDKLSSNLAAYYSTYYSATEQAAKTTDNLAKTFNDLGITSIPMSKDAFRALMDAQDLTTESGRKTYAALLQVAPAFANVADAIEPLKKAIADLPFDNLKALSFDSGKALALAAGGLDSLTSKVNAYYQTYYTDAERAALSSKKVSDTFATLGITLPTSKDALRDLINAQDLSTESGRKMYAALLDIAPAFANAADAAVAAAEKLRQEAAAAWDSAMQNYATPEEQRSAKVNQITKTLNDGGLNVTADQVAKASREDARALYEYYVKRGSTADMAIANLILSQQQKFADIRAPTAVGATSAESSGGGSSGGGSSGASAASSIASAWQSITDSIFGEVQRIRGLLAGTGAEGYALAQAKLAIATAQARAGDQDAAKSLPELSKAMLALAATNVGTLYELQKIQAKTAGSLDDTGFGLAKKYGTKVPSFDVGTDYVPHDMLAMIHEGERIVPKAFNPTIGGSTNNSEMVAELREQNALLRSLLAASLVTATSTEKTASVLVTVTENGKAMQTEAFA